jgi:hypothetical protein
LPPDADDKKYGTAVDMFAFGLLLLELFTMRRPYEECKTPVRHLPTWIGLKRGRADGRRAGGCARVDR